MNERNSGVSTALGAEMGCDAVPLVAATMHILATEIWRRLLRIIGTPAEHVGLVDKTRIPENPGAQRL